MERQPSINSSSFAVDEAVDLAEENSTDSYESQEEAAPFDPVEHLQVSLDNALSSLEFNRSLALQAQISGQIKSKELELLAMQEEAQRELVELQKVFKQGLKTVRLVSKELTHTAQRVRMLQRVVEDRHPIEYSQARDKVVSRAIVEGDEDEMYI